MVYEAWKQPENYGYEGLMEDVEYILREEGFDSDRKKPSKLLTLSAATGIALMSLTNQGCLVTEIRKGMGSYHEIDLITQRETFNEAKYKRHQKWEAGIWAAIIGGTIAAVAGGGGGGSSSSGGGSSRPKPGPEDGETHY